MFSSDDGRHKVCAVRLIYLEARLCEQDSLGTHGLSNPRSPYPCNGMAHGWKHLHQGKTKKNAEALEGERPIFQWFCILPSTKKVVDGFLHLALVPALDLAMAGGPVHQSALHELVLIVWSGAMVTNEFVALFPGMLIQSYFLLKLRGYCPEPNLHAPHAVKM